MFLMYHTRVIAAIWGVAPPVELVLPLQCLDDMGARLDG